MVYSEQQYKILEEKIKKLEKENELKDKDNKLLKKQLYNLARISLEKDSSNSLKPSSTDGFKKVVQNNRVKSRKETRKRKRTPKVFTNSM